MTTATKAVAGGVAANVVTVVLWACSLIPGWDAIPFEPKSAIVTLLSTGIGAAIVYYAPTNRATIAPATAHETAAVDTIVQESEAHASSTSGKVGV